MIVVTACFSRNPAQPYDSPKRPPDGVDEAVCFTDDPAWFDAGWQPPPHDRNCLIVHPRFRGKAPKAAPHLFFGDQDVLWIDSSMRWTGKSLSSLFDCVHPGGVGCFKHRFRDCVYEEAEASLAPGFHRYTREPIREQVAHYRTRGHPERFGLWELGTIVWRGAQRIIGERWLSEMLAWTSQDQLSFPIACRAHGLNPVTLRGDAVTNEWFHYETHNLHD